jgi:hypothetical protein
MGLLQVCCAQQRQVQVHVEGPGGVQELAFLVLPTSPAWNPVWRVVAALVGSLCVLEMDQQAASSLEMGLQVYFCRTVSRRCLWMWEV